MATTNAFPSVRPFHFPLQDTYYYNLQQLKKKDGEENKNNN